MQNAMIARYGGAAVQVERLVLPWHPSQRETLMLRDATT